MEKEIIVMNKEVLDKFEIQVDYILLECTKCGHTWGVKIFDNKIPLGAMICNVCIAEKIYQK